MLTAILAPLPEKTTLENAFSKVSSKILTPLISNKIFNTACWILYFDQEVHSPWVTLKTIQYGEWWFKVWPILYWLEEEQECAMLLNGNIDSLNTVQWDQWK